MAFRTPATRFVTRGTGHVAPEHQDVEKEIQAWAGQFRENGFTLEPCAIAARAQKVPAGSMLEFAFGEIAIPVGRVQYLQMHPMTFYEYLLALGKTPMAEQVLISPGEADPAVQKMILAQWRSYFSRRRDARIRQDLSKFRFNDRNLSGSGRNHRCIA